MEGYKSILEFNKTEKRSAVENAMVRKFPSLWALKYKPIKHKPMTFRSSHNAFAHRPWQEDILNDLHPNKVVQKSRQLGMSELATAEALWFADTHDNVNVMYTFPTNSQMADFSKTRVDPVLDGSPHLAEQVVRGLNNVSTKAIGTSNIFMRTSGDGSQGEGADIDMYCADEYDRMKIGAEYAFSESLASSKYGLMRRWSTPTVPGMGINALFLESDQRHYLHKCDKCGHWNEITYDSIVQVRDDYNPLTEEIKDGTFMFQCSHCKKELNRWGKGEWVAKYPNRKDIRGYFISQMNAVHISADSIKRREKQFAFKQLFYNYVIGLPYTNVAMEITDEDIKNHVHLQKEQLNQSDEFVAYVAGIDWGEPSWVLVLGIRQDFSIQIVSMRGFNRSESIPLYDVRQMIAHLKPYKPNLIVADAGYGADKNTELFRAFPIAAWSCNWTTVTTPYSSVNFIDHWNEKARLVRVDKTSKMQRTLQAVKQGYIGFYSWQDDYTKVIANHLKNVQILDKEKDGLVYQVATRKGPDHLACCLSYALIAVDRLTQYGLNVSTGYRMARLDI